MGNAASPTSREDLIKLTECIVKIEQLEASLKRLKEDIEKERDKKIETRRYVSDRKLTIYVTFASIVTGVVLKLLDLVFQQF